MKNFMDLNPETLKGEKWFPIAAEYGTGVLVSNYSRLKRKNYPKTIIKQHLDKHGYMHIYYSIKAEL